MILCRIIALIIVAISVYSVSAQKVPIISKSAIDSIANPVTINNSPMRFKTNSIDIGTLNEEDKPVSVEFEWTNISDHPLTISQIKTGCNCTQVNYDRKEIQPGENSKIEITYFPKGHPGPFIRKIIIRLLSTGTDNAAVLTLKGDVVPSVKPTHVYPYSMGTLLMKQKELTINRSTKSVEKIEVINSGDYPITLKAEANLLPPCITFSCEPQTINPGEIADLVISFDPAKVESNLPDSFPIIINGLKVPPANRTLYLRFKK